MYRGSSSNPNFALNLARQLFTREELKNCRVHGMRDVAQLDPDRLQQVRVNYFRVVDVADLLKEREWRLCEKAIDAAGREYQRVDRLRHEA